MMQLTYGVLAQLKVHSEGGDFFLEAACWSADEAVAAEAADSTSSRANGSNIFI